LTAALGLSLRSFARFARDLRCFLYSLTAFFDSSTGYLHCFFILHSLISLVPRSDSLNSLFSDGPYGNFAGRDASRGLAKESFDLEMVRDPELEGLDDLADLTSAEQEVLREWAGHFHYKYYHAG
jgi:hypothetical protein